MDPAMRSSSSPNRSNLCEILEELVSLPVWYHQCSIAWTVGRVNLDRVCSVAGDYGPKLSRSRKSMDNRMFRLVRTQAAVLVVFFIICQVIGTMCTLPELSEIEATASLVNESMACPMDGAIMCPPSVTSSPERQAKKDAVVALDHGLNLLALYNVQVVASVPTQWSWSSAGSNASNSLDSSPILRI